MMHLRYCIKCGEAYDIATNFSLCPGCRLIEYQEEKEREKGGENET